MYIMLVLYGPTPIRAARRRTRGRPCLNVSGERWLYLCNNTRRVIYIPYIGIILCAVKVLYTYYNEPYRTDPKTVFYTSYIDETSIDDRKRSCGRSAHNNDNNNNIVIYMCVYVCRVYSRMSLIGSTAADTKLPGDRRERPKTINRFVK